MGDVERRIYKYDLNWGNQAITDLTVPRHYVARHIDFQEEIPRIWIEVNTQSELVQRRIICLGTGSLISEHSHTHDFIATVIEPSGLHVWHFYWV